jgi:site-specific recombinase XerD
MSSQKSTKNTLRILRIVQGQKLEPLTLSFREFLLDCQSCNLSAGTLRFYSQKLEPLLTFLLALGITDARQVEPSHLRQWLLHLQDTGHNPGGQHGYFRAARAFFAWLEREGKLDTRPVRRIKSPRVPEELLEPASLEAVRAMLQVCQRKTETGARDYSVLLAVADTGARAGEVCTPRPLRIRAYSGIPDRQHRRTSRPSTNPVVLATMMAALVRAWCQLGA